MSIGNFLDRVRFSTPTTGTGAAAIGSTISPYQSMSQANAVDTTVYYYLFEDGSAWEISSGAYSSGGNTVARALIQSSTGALLNLSGAAICTVITPAQSMRFMGARVYVGTTLTTQDIRVLGALAFNTEDFDTDGFHDNVTNNTRLTIPSDKNIKYVELTGCIACDLDTNDTWRRLMIVKNGTTAVGEITRSEAGSGLWGLNVSSGPLSVISGDYFELWAQTESDASISILQNSTYFSIKVLG